MSENAGLVEGLLEELKETYLTQLPGRIDEIEQYILKLERGEDYIESYQALYRCAHSLKGSGGSYGFQFISTAGHQLEDYLLLMDKQHARGAAINSDILLGYVDVFRQAYEKFEQKSSDMSEVEEALLHLKDLIVQNNITVLVVEGSPLHATLIKEVLDGVSAQFSIVKDGVSALHRLMTESFDLVITSQEVGELNGSALIAALRLSRSVNRGKKVMLLTSNTLDELPEKFQPDWIIKKDASMQKNIEKALAEQRAPEPLTA